MFATRSGGAWSPLVRRRSAGLIVTALVKRPLWRIVSGRRRRLSQAVFSPEPIWRMTLAANVAGVTPSRRCRYTFTHSPWGRECAGVKEIRLAGGDARSRRTEAVAADHVGGGERLDVAVLPREVGTEDVRCSSSRVPTSSAGRLRCADTLPR